MYFVDNGSAVPVMPQVKPVSSATPQFFTEGGNGTPPTYPGPDWFNIFQLELLNVLKEAQINPDKANHTQLVTAMKKLFLDASSNGSDIPDKAAFLSNLGLGTAAKRNVDAGIIDGIPDMSSFRSLMIGNGYVRIPTIGSGGGAQSLIIQWGVRSTAPGSNAAYNLNIAFPTGILWATGGRGAPGSNAPMNVGPEGTQQIRIQNYAPGGVNENCFWLAIGY